MDGPPAATRVVLSFPAGASGWARSQFETDRYRGFFARTLGTVTVGDVREEFVDVGCCGDSLDVPFRVEAVETAKTDDGTAEAGDASVKTATVTRGTLVDYVERPGSIDGGWRVQSAAGPTE